LGSHLLHLLEASYHIFALSGTVVLDQYPDGTARLRIPAGKTKKERLVPVNEEAAEAIRVVQTVRTGERGFRDSYTGVVTHYLFMYHGKLLSTRYLFDAPSPEPVKLPG
jgi:hypothetical protein